MCGRKADLVEHHLSYNPPEVIRICQKCHEKEHGNIPIVSELNLKMRQYFMLVKLSVMCKNWLYAYKQTFGTNPIKVDLKEIENKKKTIVKDIESMLKEEKRVKGVGAISLGGILAFAHPSRFPSLRKFLVYCGYKKSARITGKYNRKVCGLMNQVVRSLIMSKNEKYYPLYLKIKKDLGQQHPEYPKGKIDGMSRNRVATLLLKEIYEYFKASSP
jgi:hypothetical protein